MSLTNIEQPAWDDCFTDNDIVERRFGLAQHLEVARALAPIAISPHIRFVESTADNTILSSIPSQPIGDISRLAS